MSPDQICTNGLTCGGWYWMLANFRCGEWRQVFQKLGWNCFNPGWTSNHRYGRNAPVTLEILEEQFLCKDNSNGIQWWISYWAGIIRSGNAISTAASGRDVILPSGAGVKIRLESCNLCGCCWRYCLTASAVWPEPKASVIAVSPSITDSVNQVTGDIGFISQYFWRLHRILSPKSIMWFTIALACSLVVSVCSSCSYSSFHLGLVHPCLTKCGIVSMAGSCVV